MVVVAKEEGEREVTAAVVMLGCVNDEAGQDIDVIDADKEVQDIPRLLVVELVQEGVGSSVGGIEVDEEVVEVKLFESADEVTLTPGFKGDDDEKEEEEEVAQEGQRSRAGTSTALCWAVDNTAALLSTG